MASSLLRKWSGPGRQRLDFGTFCRLVKIPDQNGEPAKNILNHASFVHSEDARFLLVGYHPAERRLMVADGCQPVPTQPGDFREEVTEQYRHNCNAINGFSGAPLFVVTPDFDGVICLHSSSADLGTQAPQIFNRSANANSCEKISPEVIQALNTLAYSD